MLRGSATTKIDAKGRLKMPTELRRRLVEEHGREVFITSVLGDSALIYPVPVWEAIEQRLQALPSTDRTRRKFLERVHYYGQEANLDAQGRVVIPPILRESALIEGDVVVGARLDHVEVWNKDRLTRRFEGEPFTEEDFAYLSQRGI